MPGRPVHWYFAVDHCLLYGVAGRKGPELVAKLEAMLRELPEG